MSSTPTQALIDGSFFYKDYSNPVAYDPNYTISYGYWICKRCCSKFFGGLQVIHKEDCSIKNETSDPFCYKSREIIYVFGDKEGRHNSPLSAEDINQIKKIAKSKFSISPAQS